MKNKKLGGVNIENIVPIIIPTLIIINPKIITDGPPTSMKTNFFPLFIAFLMSSSEVMVSY
jgi:hypothetical protein